MSFVTLDFETYYAKDYSLTRLTTEEYIQDKRFEVIGVGIKIDDGETKWFAGNHKEIKLQLDKIDWANSALLCHNTQFDGAILAWHFGIVPQHYFDTLCMARAIHGVDAGGSLAALVERYKLGKKGTEVVNALGKRRKDFSDEELDRYGEYCINDVELTFKLFNTFMLDYFPQSELELIDMTLRMYTQPVLCVDDALLTQRLEEVTEEKRALLESLQSKLGCTEIEEVRKKLASNPQFAAVLKEFGVEPPMKTSPTTGKETFALAKNDEGFIELLEHDNPFIPQLCAVRLGTKSTLEESRIERFIGIGSRNRGRLPIPLKYYGAHTGRWAGADSVNFQNLPSRDKKKKTLKNSVVAPKGHVVINCDSSQIEARVLAWLAGQKDVTDQFAKGDDVYSIFATKIYKKPISKENPVERFVGKTCLGSGTRVLTRRGWVPIVEVTTDDQLWDGVEWVNHCGVSFMGLKPTILLSGLELTADHEILTDHTKWETAHYVQTHDTVFQSALNLAISSLSVINNTYHPIPARVGDGNRYVGVRDAVVNTRMLNTILKQVDQLLAVVVQSAKRVINGGGNINPFYRMTSIVRDYLTVLQRRSPDVTPNPAAYLSITEVEELRFAKNGVMTEPSFFNTSRHSMGGTFQNFKWIASTLTEITSRVTSGLYPQVRTCPTNAKLKTLKPVFDILNSGSRNRFTVLTDRGPIIVHNCILGLGYGTGAKKLQHTLKTQPPGADLSEERCKEIVSLYRETNYKITELWKDSDAALTDMMTNMKGEYYLGQHKVLKVSKVGIELPNGLYIRYPNLRMVDDRATYDSRKGPVSIWGGAVVENVVQALARIIVGEQMLKIREKYRPVLTVHDAAVMVVPESEKEEAMTFITHVMSTPPAWATGLPVSCEAKSGKSYGDC